MGLLELMALLAKLKGEATDLVANADAKKEDLDAKIKEIQIVKAKIEIAKMQEDDEQTEREKLIATNITNSVNAKNVLDINNEIQNRVFAKFLGGIPLDGDREIKALSSLTDKDGKLLIPADVRTAINTWLREYVDMAQYVTHEPTTTVSGSRIYEIEAEALPFDNVAELTVIPSMGSPEFQKIDYTCNFYKGMMKIPNELLKTETGGLVAYISQWIAKKLVATRNIIAFYGTGVKCDGFLGVATGGIAIDKTKTTPIGLAVIDRILNVTLPVAIKNSSECRIYTNQNGFNYYASLVDSQGRKYLQPDVTNAAIYRYSGKEIVVFDNTQLKNETIATKSQFPTIVGNLKEAMKMFELESFTVESDRSRYFDEDATGMRVIGALTTKFFDKKAAVAVFSPEA